MKVFLDDAEIPVEAPTLGAALSAGVEACGRSGRIIIEVWADGSPAPDEDIAAPPDASPYAEELRLVSAEPKSLVRTVLLDVAEALEATQDDQRRAADLIQTGETGQALTTLSHVLQSWEAVRRAVEEGAALLDLPVGSVEGAAIDTEMIEELFGRLGDVKNALKNDDWSTLSDILAYDMDEQAQRWRDGLARLAEHIDTD